MVEISFLTYHFRADNICKNTAIYWLPKALLSHASDVHNVQCARVQTSRHVPGRQWKAIQVHQLIILQSKTISLFIRPECKTDWSYNLCTCTCILTKNEHLRFHWHRFRVMIGSNENTETVIKNEDSGQQVKRATSGILDCERPTRFWISWVDETISLGRGTTA